MLHLIRNFSMSPKDHSIKVRAQRTIKKGEEITIQYLSFMFGHLRRKKTINSYWFFDCECPRCQDPKELGKKFHATYFHLNLQFLDKF